MQQKLEKSAGLIVLHLDSYADFIFCKLYSKRIFDGPISREKNLHQSEKNYYTLGIQF